MAGGGWWHGRRNFLPVRARDRTGEGGGAGKKGRKKKRRKKNRSSYENRRRVFSCAAHARTAHVVTAAPTIAAIAKKKKKTFLRRNDARKKNRKNSSKPISGNSEIEKVERRDLPHSTRSGDVVFTFRGERAAKSVTYPCSAQDTCRQKRPDPYVRTTLGSDFH